MHFSAGLVKDGNDIVRDLITLTILYIGEIIATDAYISFTTCRLNPARETEEL